MYSSGDISAQDVYRGRNRCVCVCIYIEQLNIDDLHGQTQCAFQEGEKLNQRDDPGIPAVGTFCVWAFHAREITPRGEPSILDSLSLSRPSFLSKIIMENTSRELFEFVFVLRIEASSARWRFNNA